MDITRTFCPECGHKFEQGEYGYVYESGLLDYNCPDCEWEGTEHAVINAAKIEDDLNDKLSDYDLEGIEITDEDVNNVMTLIEDGEEYEEAISFVLCAIRDCLD